jgi:quercetin dioxygenase-like cupin family protein
VKGKPPATVKFTDGDTRFASATFAHFVRTTSPEPFRNVTVEILQDESLRNSTAKWDPAKNEDRGLDVLEGGTKQILFVKDGIRATEFELQPGGVVPMHHHEGPHLLVAVSDLDIRRSDTLKAEMSVLERTHFKSGDSQWFPAGYSHALTNTGTKPAKFVTLEFP